MNWNGQREYLNHLIAKRQEPQKSPALQNEFDAKRKSKIAAAMQTRPVFLPLQFDMQAAGQISPYSATTNALGYDVIVVGLKTDNPTRDIIVKRTENEKPLVYVGDEANLYLRTDEICGLAATPGGGQLGAFYLPSPIPLGAGQRITIQMFKADTTALPENANIVLIAIRVMPRTYGELLLDADERRLCEELISLREVPQIRFLKLPVSFSSAIAGGTDTNLFSPRVPEPLLIRGVRTTLRESKIEIGIVGEPDWTTLPTPIWGVAAEDELVHENYQWFAKPIYLHSNGQIEVRRITNSIDGVNIDAQFGNSLTFICETV